MRIRDIESLLAQYCGDGQPPGDLMATVNLMAYFCSVRNLAELAPYGPDVAKAMAQIVQDAGPSIRLEQAERNLDLIRRLKLEALNHGSYEKAYAAISSYDMPGPERLRQIKRRKFADATLFEFMRAAREGSEITCDQLMVAQDIIAKIRRLLLRSNTKGAEMRTKLGLKGWREFGKTELDEDIFEEVQRLLQAGVKSIPLHTSRIA